MDRSEPLVCVFLGASRPWARFARDENLEIFENQKNRFSKKGHFYEYLENGYLHYAIIAEILKNSLHPLYAVDAWVFTKIVKSIYKMMGPNQMKVRTCWDETF